MATLQAGDIDDIVLSILPSYDRFKWTDLTSELQDHVGMRQILNKKKVGFQGGRRIDFQAMTSHNDSARNVGLNQEDEKNIGNVMDSGNIGWRHTTANWSYDVRELAMCTGPAEIVSIIKERRAAGMVAMAEKMEENVWGTPATAADTATPHGVDYWVVEAATEGFYGLSRISTTTAGISTADVARWRNWSGNYTVVSKTDLIRMMRKAYYYTKFRSPVPMAQHNWGGDRGIYMNYDVMYLMEESLEAQNDSLGKDIAPMDGRATFRGVPLTWVPYLDSDAKDPVIGINWKHFRPVFLRGMYMVEGKPKEAPEQHMNRTVHVDCTYNFLCRNRREQFRIELA